MRNRKIEREASTAEFLDYLRTLTEEEIEACSADIDRRYAARQRRAAVTAANASRHPSRADTPVS